jgi:hypothetical protein
MEEFTIQISPGNYVTKKANNIDEAIKLVKADIAFNQGSESLDNVFFDYETGVPNIKGLRSKLGRIEMGPKMFAEQDALMTNLLGSDGFTRNSKGQLAITPMGMKQLGLDYKTVTLSDGSVEPINTIIDERSLNLMGGDLADLSGTVGPVLGAIAALSPQRQVFKGIFNLLVGRPRLERAFRAGLGSVAGESVEEVLDAQEGFNLKDRNEQAMNLGSEFVLGFGGQTIGELIGTGYKLLLGKNVATDKLRLYNLASRKISIGDVKKLDRDLGREATEKEIQKAIKEGKVSLYKAGAAVAQQTLGRKLVGRTQAVGEQIFGPGKRGEDLKDFIFNELDTTLKNINTEKASLIKYIDESTKGSLDEQVTARLRQLQQAEANTTKQLESFFNDIVEETNNFDLYNVAYTQDEIGAIMKDALTQADDLVLKQAFDRYSALDDAFAALPINAKRVFSDNIKHRLLKKIKRMTEEYKVNNPAFNFNVARTEDVTGVAKAVEQLVEYLDELSSSSGASDQLLNLTQMRNIISKLKKVEAQEIIKGQDSNFLGKVLKEFENQLEAFQDPKIFMRKFDTEGLERLEPKMTKEQQKELVAIVKELQDANLTYRTRREAFDNIKIKRAIANAENTGAFDEYDVFQTLVKKGSDKDLGMFFRAIKEFDGYQADVGIKSTKELEIKTMLQRRLFRDALEESTSFGLDPINFNDFARYIRRFQGQYPKKLDILFDGQSQQIVDTIEQISRIRPNLKPKDILKLADDITATERGLYIPNAGKKFVDKLRDLAEDSQKLADFEANTAISELPRIGVDEATKKIFRPNAGNNIQILKDTVSPEVFAQIQRASMNKLIKNSIDLNGKGNITDIFKSNNLKNSLDSYGDETLDAMFGKETRQGLRDLADTIDDLTPGEVGRGGAAGTLIAAGIAVNAFNISMLPTIASLALFRNLFSRPGFLKLMTKTDKGSVLRVIEAFEQAARQEGIRLVGRGYNDFSKLTQEEFDALAEDIKQTGIIDEISDQASEIIDTTIDQAAELEDQVARQRQITQTTPIEFPEIRSIDINRGLDTDRVDFAEQIAGRPIV